MGLTGITWGLVQLIADGTVIAAWLQELVEWVLLASFQPRSFPSTSSLLLLPHAGPCSSSSETSLEEPQLLHSLSFHFSLGVSRFLFEGPCLTSGSFENPTIFFLFHRGPSFRAPAF